MTKRKPKRDASGWVKVSTFRLSADTLAQLDAVADDLTAATGVTHTRTDAIRSLAHRAAEKIRKRKEGEK
jgi:hypothetical protein